MGSYTLHILWLTSYLEFVALSSWNQMAEIYAVFSKKKNKKRKKIIFVKRGEKERAMI